MTIQQLPVFTVNGICGQTVYYDIDGRMIAFSCHHAGTAGGGAVRGKGIYTSRDIFNSGDSGGGVDMLVDTLDRLSNEGRTDDHLMVIRPDGEIGYNADHYREVLDSHHQLQGAEATPLQVDLGNRVQSYLDHDVDERAQPFIVVCPRTLGSIGAEQLMPALRAAAAARAPIRLMTL